MSLDKLPDALSQRPYLETILITKGEYIRLIECFNKLESCYRYANVTAFIDGGRYAQIVAPCGSGQYRAEIGSSGAEAATKPPLTTIRKKTRTALASQTYVEWQNSYYPSSISTVYIHAQDL